MECPRCQQENPPYAKFCLACASPVDGFPLQKSYADLKGEIDRLQGEIEGLRRSLGEALEQQTATSELLKVIGRSTSDLEPVFKTLAENAVRLCEAEQASIFRFDGRLLQAVVTHNLHPAQRDFLEQNPILPGRGSGAGRAAVERRTIHIHDVQAADWL
jgi:two-component system NtrC family sensor kinase